MTYVCVHSKSLQSCPTLCDPIDCRPPDSSVFGILQVRLLEWVAISFSRRLSQPREWTCVSCSSCTAGSFFTIELWGSLTHTHIYTHTRVCMCVYVCVYVCVCLYVYIKHVYTHAHTCVYVYTCMHTHVCVCVHTCMCMYMCMNMYKCIYAHKCVYVCVYVYMCVYNWNIYFSFLNPI